MEEGLSVGGAEGLAEAQALNRSGLAWLRRTMGWSGALELGEEGLAFCSLEATAIGLLGLGEGACLGPRMSGIALEAALASLLTLELKKRTGAAFVFLLFVH